MCVGAVFGGGSECRKEQLYRTRNVRVLLFGTFLYENHYLPIKKIESKLCYSKSKAWAWLHSMNVSTKYYHLKLNIIDLQSLR